MATAPVNTLTRATAHEFMDDPARSDRELRDALRDLGRINRFLGGRAFVLSFLERILPAWRAQGEASRRPLLLLDVATGGADIPLAVAGWAARRRVPVRIIAVDRHPATVRLAREATAACPAIRVLQADARALPFSDGAFDVCLCTLALHHLAPAEALELLRRLHRLGRIGFLAADLVRGWGGYAGVWLLTRLSRSPMLRHDGPLSVRRAFSWEEYRRLAAASGIPDLRVFRLPLFRIALAQTTPCRM
jgi:SAM-dependent methyltransferase